STRSLCTVGTAWERTSSQRTPRSSSSRVSSAPRSSTPTTPASTQRAPSAATFNATFAAPPGRCSDEPARTTGTGASGEIRVVSPNQYSSSIASPATSTRTREKSGIVSATVVVPPNSKVAPFYPACDRKPSSERGARCIRRQRARRQRLSEPPLSEPGRRDAAAAGSTALRIAAVQARHAAVEHDGGGRVALAAELRAFGKLLRSKRV